MKIPERFYTVKFNLVFCLFVPVFALLFMVIYNPTFGIDSANLDYLNQHKGFALPILCAIQLGVLLVSRSLLSFAIIRHRITEMEFLLWQFIEFTVNCLFADLFLSLYLHVDYFTALPRIMLISFGVNLFPYAFYWVLVERMDRDARIADAYNLMTNMRGGDQTERGMMRFSDEKGNTKLVVGAERIISIASSGNYITILYDDGGSLMRFSLHNTMKAIEPLATANGLVRCHRSYFVNINKVKVIRRTSDGVVAEIDHPGVDNVPVSKTYAPDLITLFSQLETVNPK